MIISNIQTLQRFNQKRKRNKLKQQQKKKFIKKKLKEKRKRPQENPKKLIARQVWKTKSSLIKKTKEKRHNNQLVIHEIFKNTLT